MRGHRSAVIWLLNNQCERPADMRHVTGDYDYPSLSTCFGSNRHRDSIPIQKKGQIQDTLHSSAFSLEIRRTPGNIKHRSSLAAGDMKHWLMKAEPNSRIVKGKDVKFSVDDFEAVGTTAWEGVRNFEARNLMKEMSTGDKVGPKRLSCRPEMASGCRYCSITRTARIRALQASRRYAKRRIQITPHGTARIRTMIQKRTRKHQSGSW